MPAVQLKCTEQPTLFLTFLAIILRQLGDCVLGTCTGSPLALEPTLVGKRVTGGASAALPPAATCAVTSAYALQYVRIAHVAHFGACVHVTAPCSIIACARARGENSRIF